MKALWCITVAAVGALLGTPRGAGAQEANLTKLDGEDGEAVNQVYLRTGAEYGFVAGVGFGRALTVANHRILVYGELTVPWAGLDASDNRLRVGALVPIVGGQHWRLAGVFAPTVRGTRNDVSRMVGLGGDIGVTGGYFAPHWFVATELGVDGNLATHIAHTDRYRKTIYAKARDGWYDRTGSVFRYGVQAGATFGRHDLVLRTGMMQALPSGDLLLPFYGTLTLNTRW